MKILTVCALSVLSALMACSGGAPASSASSTGNGVAADSTELAVNSESSEEEILIPESATSGSPEDGAVAQSFTPIGDYEGGTKYRGTVVVTGSFLMMGAEEEQHWTCFQIDGPDARKIPRPHGDDRDTGFCIEGGVSAAQASGEFKIRPEILAQMSHDCGIRGEATIEVKDYDRYNCGECDTAIDLATLVRVVHPSTSHALECGLYDENAP